MKILHICLSGTFNDKWGYQENILAEYNLKSGHDVTIIASNWITQIDNGKDQYVEPGIYYGKNGLKIYRIRYTHLLPLYIAKKLKIYDNLLQIITAEKPDMIFHHGCIGFTILPVNQYKKTHSNCILFMDNHSDEYNCCNTLCSILLHKYIWKMLLHTTIPYVNKYFGVLPLRCTFLNKVYGIPNNKIAMLMMGVDDENIIHMNRNVIRAEIRKKYDLTSDDFLIISGGKIDLKKNIHLLIAAVNKLKSNNVRLIIFGIINKEVEKIIKNDISDRIILVGWCDSEYIYSLFFASDLAVFPGTHSVLWEQACAAGLPGVYNRMPGIQHININNNVVFISKPTIYKLTTTIEELINDKEKYQKMKHAASIAYKSFLYSKIQEQMFNY